MLTVLIAAFLTGGPDDVPAPAFKGEVVDGKVGIGYGVAVADMDGDRKPDILLVDKDVVAWYRNPGWEKSVVARKLTSIDHVCLAARDIDGDGKAEVAAGAGWNPSDTLMSGSVHYLIAPADRGQLWQPVELPHEPTVHRMRWIRGPGDSWNLVVAPLHGRGNKDAAGAGARVLAYQMPSNPQEPWSMTPLDDSLHVIHNLEVVDWDQNGQEEVLLAAREGVFHYQRGKEKWERTQLVGKEPGEAAFEGAGEVRTGRLPGGKRFLSTIEPFHGNRVVSYSEPAGGLLSGLWRRQELDSTLNGGHAVGCGDLLGIGSDQIVAGWRLKDAKGKVGIRLYVPEDAVGKGWRTAVIDDNTMACEDLTVADLDGDGRPDIVASGRDTHNLKVYWNRSTSR